VAERAAPSAPEPVLAVRDLHKSFTLHAVGGRVVEGLRGVDVSVAAGEHVALAGASGAGKSTLLKCIYRTYLADRGEVWLRTAGGERLELRGLDQRRLADLREQEVGYVSQFLRAEPRRGTLEVVTRAGVRRGMAPDDARAAAEDSLARVRIGPELWHTYPTLLSGGEKQRVNLAAGTISPPRLLLLDEPVSALDPAGRAAVLDLIAQLADLGVAVLAVFHDVEAMRVLADRVVVLEHGRVVAQGAAESVLVAPMQGVAS
jgi:alpha-D-ribose 1-methylphosphonate 5-triphosphate synthase subunit PhnL